MSDPAQLSSCFPSYIEHESYLAFCVAITFLTLGIVGLLGSDDILSCFIVGNVINWDDSYREGSEGQAFQEVIDSLLNSVSSGGWCRS